MGKISDLRDNVAAAAGASVLAAMASAGGIVYPFHRHRWAPWAYVALSVVLGLAYVTILMRPGGGEPPAQDRTADGGSTPERR